MLRFLTAGESHGPGLVAILEGLPAGLEISEEKIKRDLLRRQHGSLSGKPYQGASPRMKKEHDAARLISGVMSGRTTGAPLALLIENIDHSVWNGAEIPAMTIPRPGHADLTGALKYGYDDLRPALERASARETAARVAAGAVCRIFLENFGIRVGSHVVRISGIHYQPPQDTPLAELLDRAEESALRCADPQIEAQMQAEIGQAMNDGSTLGGWFEVIALNVPAGLGSYVQWDRRLDGRLAAALVSIQAIKGVEFGDGFALGYADGRTASDEIQLDAETRVLVRPSNHAGGLEGGVTNGQPLVMRAVMKPISTTISPKKSVDLAGGNPAQTRYERSDFCAVPRAAVVAEAMTCFVLADALLEKTGGDSMEEIRSRIQILPSMHISSFHLSSTAKKFWED